MGCHLLADSSGFEMFQFSSFLIYFLFCIVCLSFPFFFFFLITGLLIALTYQDLAWITLFPHVLRLFFLLIMPPFYFQLEFLRFYLTYPIIFYAVTPQLTNPEVSCSGVSSQNPHHEIIQYKKKDCSPFHWPTIS